MEKNNTKNYFLIKLILLVVLLWGLSAVLIIAFLSNWSDRGTFGDLFGAVNALFSALAFAVLIYTIILQREEISGKSLAKVLIHYPLMTMKITVAIYWQALKLWVKGCPLYTHPGKTKTIQANS